MSHPRRFRFAADLHQPLPGRTWIESVREVEQLGYSTMFVPDHFDEGLGPVAAIATAAAATETLHVGALVFDCDFRHPAVLKGLWSGGPFSFAGEHYTITDMPGSPAPHRPGGPPILVGGGAPRLLRWAGATADIVGVNASIHSGEIDQAAAQDALADRIDEKVAWVREGAGDRFDDLELNAWLAVAEITDDPAVVDGIAALFGTDAASLRRSPLALVGSPGDVTEMLHERRERWGYSYHVIPGDKVHDFAPTVAALTGT